MNKTYLTLSAALLITIFSIGSASAYNHEYCSNYAQRAVGQYYEAQQRGLTNIGWPRWGDHRQGHYDFCMSAPDLADIETQTRQQRLDSGS